MNAVAERFAQRLERHEPEIARQKEVAAPRAASSTMALQNAFLMARDVELARAPRHIAPR